MLGIKSQAIVDSRMDYAVATLATNLSIGDLKVFLATLALFNSSKPTVYLLCDTQTKETIVKADLYDKIVYSTELDQYSGKSRISMERTSGLRYKTRWEDFMMEKASVLEQAFTAGEKRVFFFDSDICFMGPLPVLPPTVRLGLCRHMIKLQDEARYGTYNAGFVYTTDPNMPQLWRSASTRSRYYDQAALEEVEQNYSAGEILHLPMQNNYGWWRMFQGSESSQIILSRWSMNPAPMTSGITIMGEPLLSIHTHWGETDINPTSMFNKYVYRWLCQLKSHPPAAALLKILHQEFPHLWSPKAPKN